MNMFVQIIFINDLTIVVNIVISNCQRRAPSPSVNRKKRSQENFCKICKEMNLKKSCLVKKL